MNFLRISATLGEMDNQPSADQPMKGLTTEELEKIKLRTSLTIRAVQASFGMSQKKMAELIGYTPPGLNKIISRTNAPTSRFLIDFYHAFNVGAGWILHGDLRDLPTDVHIELEQLTGETGGLKSLLDRSH